MAASLLLRRAAWSQLRTASYSLARCCFRSDSSVPLTADHYNVRRGDYATITELDIQEFQSIVGGRIISEATEAESYNIDWLGNYRGQGSVVLRPKTTEEVSRILSHCNERRLAVVPQGGNTALVGGSVPVFDEIVLSLSLMNQVISLDQNTGILVCQSGCVLESLDDMLAEKGLMMPLDLGAKGSCQIGGNASTNAGGVRFLRYGSLHGNIIGIEAVLADGTVLDCLTTMRKDNTGYDLKQIFIGAEGTLGVLTAISILVPPRPKSVNVVFMGCSTMEQVLQVYATAKAMLGEILSAVEFLDSTSMQLTEKHMGLSNPITTQPFYVLIETSGSHEQHDREKLNSFLECVMAEGTIEDGAMATDFTKLKSMWAIRESVTEAQRHEGVVYKYDMSVPLSNFYDLVVEVRERCEGVAKCVMGHGHVGDGNLHLNIVGETHSEELLNLIEPFVYDRTAQFKGSISAEHGLGFKKAPYIYHSKSREAVRLMGEIKRVFDPKGILNPYKLLPE